MISLMPFISSMSGLDINFYTCANEILYFYETLGPSFEYFSVFDAYDHLDGRSCVRDCVYFRVRVCIIAVTCITVISWQENEVLSLFLRLHFRLCIQEVRHGVPVLNIHLGANSLSFSSFSSQFFQASFLLYSDGLRTGCRVSSVRLLLELLIICRIQPGSILQEGKALVKWRKKSVLRDRVLMFP